MENYLFVKRYLLQHRATEQYKTYHDEEVFDPKTVLLTKVHVEGPEFAQYFQYKM